jgi:hypothetical protein
MGMKRVVYVGVEISLVRGMGRGGEEELVGMGGED